MFRPQRPSANMTRAKILEAARQCFLAKGFDGVSVQEIADKAGVNQNLLFHHFQNKQTLWQRVKEEIIANSKLRFKPDVSNLQNFITGIVRYRFALYDENPDLVRLMKWQQLEVESANVDLYSSAIPATWHDSIVYLQKRRLIDPHLDSQVVILFLAATINGVFTQTNLMITTAQKEAYQLLVIKSCIQGIVAKSMVL